MNRKSRTQLSPKRTLKLFIKKAVIILTTKQLMSKLETFQQIIGKQSLK